MSAPYSGTFTAYSPEGFEIIMTITADSAVNFSKALTALSINDITANPFDPKAKPLTASIAMVVRREYKKDGNKKRAVDCYTQFGKYRYTTIYLDGDANATAEFNKNSGLVFDKLPVYPSQTAIERDRQNPQEFEVIVKSPFAVRIEEAGEKTIGDKTMMTYRFAGYGDTASTRAETGDETHTGNGHASDGNGTGAEMLDDLTIEANAKTFVKKWHAKQVGNTIILAALSVGRMSEWKHGAAKADATIEDYLARQVEAEANRSTDDIPF